jgi:hypothetical protein
LNRIVLIASCAGMSWSMIDGRGLPSPSRLLSNATNGRSPRPESPAATGCHEPACGRSYRIQVPSTSYTQAMSRVRFVGRPEVVS